VKKSLALEKEEQKKRAEYLQSQVNDLWRTLPEGNKEFDEKDDVDISKYWGLKTSLPEENLLYFIEKHSPHLQGWEREILRIVRKIAQYFYPQMQTQVMNEGWASFCHYYLMNRLHDDGLIDDGGHLEFLALHTNVLNQREGAHFNPYYLGFEIFNDIRRICTDPTAEDTEWFPDIAGCQNWVDVCQDIVANYRDESFIRQFLSPHLIRKMRMFAILDNKDSEFYHITGHATNTHYKNIRNVLADQYLIGNKIPDLAVTRCNLKGSRRMVVEYRSVHGRELDEESARAVVQHMYGLWGHEVLIESPSGRRIAQYPLDGE
jgi:spore cortex formation protein SpoVR/YcgB (stage V sporulation)